MASVAPISTGTVLVIPKHREQRRVALQGRVFDICEQSSGLLQSFRFARHFSDQARALLGHAYQLLGGAAQADNLADCKENLALARRALERGAAASQLSADHWSQRGGRAAREIYQQSRALSVDNYYGGMR